MLPPQPRVHWIADPRLLFDHPYHLWVVRRGLGYIPFDRRRRLDRGMLRKAGEALAAGCPVAIFPEGDYGDTEGRLQALRPGFAWLALRNQVPVLPIALSGTKELWFRKPIVVNIGPPISPRGHTRETLVGAARLAVESLLPEYSDPPGPRLLARWAASVRYREHSPGRPRR